MRIFSLDYFRQIINYDEVHFLSAKKKTQFKMKNQLGPFICNNREAGPEADRLLQQMKFRNIFIWHYDPHGVINKLRPNWHLTSTTQDQTLNNFPTNLSGWRTH